MFCHNCEETLIEGSSFCSNCGAKVTQEQIDTLEYSSEQSKENVGEVAPQNDILPSISPSVQANEKVEQVNKPHERQKPRKIPTFKSKLPIIIPILTFVVVSVVLVLYFYNEQNKNDIVIELQQTAENAALEGKYAEAIEALNEAIDIRSDYEVLGVNIVEIERAQAFYTQLEAVHQLVTNEEFDKAEEKLSALKEKANSETGPLFESFHESIAMEETGITVGKIKQEIESLTTVDSLANRLSTLETLSSTEVDDIKAQILNQIVQITNDEATEQLANNQLAKALDTVNKGLSYKTDDQQLLELKEQIEEEKIAYEQAQEQAGKEDLHNRTAAVEITSFTAELDENGDVYFDGTIISTATVPIYSLTAFYAVYDVNGQYLFEGFVYIDPYTLDPGDEGYFSGFIEAVNQDVTVEIFNITWYFN